VRAAGATTLTVLARLRHSHSYRKLATVHTNSLGYWTLHSSTAAEVWRVRWVSPTGVRYEGPPIKAS